MKRKNHNKINTFFCCKKLRVLFTNWLEILCTEFLSEVAVTIATNFVLVAVSWSSICIIIVCNLYISFWSNKRFCLSVCLSDQMTRYLCRSLVYRRKWQHIFRMHFPQRKLCRNKSVCDAIRVLLFFLSQFHENAMFYIKMDPCL